jgi:hypothetical protein
MDEESTGKMVFPLGITSSGTKNPPEEEDSAGNYKLVDSGIYLKDRIPRGVISSGTMIHICKI